MSFSGFTRWLFWWSGADEGSGRVVDTVYGVLGAIASIGLYGLALVVIGVLLGLLVGVLPGLTFVMGVLLLVPFTYSMDTGSALTLMLALYVAGTYGGALTSILLNIPGEPNNVPLLWDGHGMARQGRAAEALGWAALAAFAGGLVSWVVLVFAAKPFASVALQLSSPEYFAIVLLGLASVLALTETSVVAALIAMFVGMLISTVGVSQVTGVVRYDFGTTILRDGIDYLAVMIGMYALGEVITRFGEKFGGQVAQQPARVATIIPGLRAIRDRGGSFLRGILTGSLIGTVPGAGATVASFVSYGLEKQFGKHKGEVGEARPAASWPRRRRRRRPWAGPSYRFSCWVYRGALRRPCCSASFCYTTSSPGPRSSWNSPISSTRSSGRSCSA
jgi:putative tricarboxylic transport membrane protein